MTRELGTEFIDPIDVSECCAAEMFGEPDICPRCREFTARETIENAEPPCEAIAANPQTHEAMCFDIERCGWRGNTSATGDNGDGGKCPRCGEDTLEYDAEEYETFAVRPQNPKVQAAISTALGFVAFTATGALFAVMFIFDNDDIHTHSRAFWTAIFGG
ncbi:hypothetical protein [Geitlerinema calcuttense]|uniref:Uncharacterized protein n=1 Tax=Geitlerinema calcuttense NRMC-F 0142 TaxID=2922238 RepID=A0ABT7LV50_9CYAN|nr:hypothetical protein [Geitlerinema calcuttense]MDL5055917.1 hypothetical protein [Geitlerinema calcuttense NRMC-F 0142]